MDKRKSYYLMIDTETALKDSTQSIKGTNALCYDIGLAIIDKKGNIYTKYSYVVKEIFFNNTLMRSAYYYKKVPQYLEDIIQGTRTIQSFEYIENKIKEIYQQWNCKAIIAHNAKFDFYSIRTTARHIYKNSHYQVFNDDFIWWDTLKMTKDVTKLRKTYKHFCKKYNFLTKSKQPQLKAETLYRFLTNNPYFKEAHTGLEDVLIEKEIFAWCMQQHCKMQKALFN